MYNETAQEEDFITSYSLDDFDEDYEDDDFDEDDETTDRKSVV